MAYDLGAFMPPLCGGGGKKSEESDHSGYWIEQTFENNKKGTLAIRNTPHFPDMQYDFDKMNAFIKGLREHIK